MFAMDHPDLSRGEARELSWAVTQSLLTDRLSWDVRHGNDPDQGNENFNDFLIPDVGAAPVTAFQVLLSLFVLGIGLIVMSMRFSLGGGQWVPMLSIGLLASLFGVTAVLPWLIDRLFGRVSGGPLSLQLALRRLGAAGDGPARAVSGIVVTVAGAIALQSLFANAWNDSTVEVAEFVEEAYANNEFGASGFQLQVDLRSALPGNDPTAVAETPGVEEALAYSGVGGVTDDGSDVRVLIAGCPSLQQMADLLLYSPRTHSAECPGLCPVGRSRSRAITW